MFLPGYRNVSKVSLNLREAKLEMVHEGRTKTLVAGSLDVHNGAKNVVADADIIEVEFEEPLLCVYDKNTKEPSAFSELKCGRRPVFYYHKVVPAEE